MKINLVIFLFFIFQFASGQNAIKKVFIKKSFVNGNLYKEIRDTIEVTGKIDIYFFKANFFSPYYIPDRFIDKRYKDEVISIWAQPDVEKDYRKNWEYKYSYDSLGRVINYSYSSCLLCSQLPYNYIVKYNSSGMVEEIYSTINTIESFRFYYNNGDGIIKLQRYLFGILEQVIELEN